VGGFRGLALFGHLVALGFVEAESLAVDQGFGNFLMGATDDAVEGLACDAHLLGCVLAVETFEVAQADGLPFIGGEDVFFKFTHGDPGGFEV